MAKRKRNKLRRTEKACREVAVLGLHDAVQVTEHADGTASVCFYAPTLREYDSFEQALEAAKRIVHWPLLEGENAPEPQIIDANGHFEVHWVSNLSFK